MKVDKRFKPIFVLVKKLLFVILAIFVQANALAQCAMCTKTAAGLGDDAAEGLNNGIIFLALTPLAILLSLAYLWYRKNKHEFVG